MPKSIIPEVLPPAEAIITEWDDARDKLSKVKLHGQLFLLSQVLLGWRLQAIKKTLGFDQRGGDRAKSHGETLLQTWEQHLNAELGIKKPTAYRFEQCFLGAKAKLKRLGTHTRALELLDQSPAELSPEDLKTLQAIVKEITDGLTQKALLLELHLVKSPQGAGAAGGNTTNNTDDQQEKEEPNMSQLSFILFSSAQSSVANLRDHTDYTAGLAALPLNSDDESTPTLTTLEATYTGLLADIQTAKAKAEAQLQKSLTHV